MSDQEPTALAAAAQLRRRLQQLGQDDQVATRDAAQESAREARMAAKMDLQLEALVKARGSWRRALVGLAAAAALVALALGARQLRFGAGGLAISPEPVSGVTPSQPTASAPPEPDKPAAVLLTPSSVPRVNSVPSTAAAPSAASSVEPQSTLAEENQLFKAAAEAGRNGDVNRAVAQLDKLLVEHPESPLAQTALVRKFRLLAKAGRVDEARREAERYLATYPTGFAVSEAHALQAQGVEQGAP
jgi:hypothetical protein